MKQIGTFVLALILSQVAFAKAKPLITTDQLKEFGSSFTQEKQEGCQVAPRGTYFVWLENELRALGFTNLQKVTAPIYKWQVEPVQMTINEKAIPAQWLPYTPGTEGSVNDQPFKTGQLSAQLVDVGNGSLDQIQAFKNQESLKNAVWLVERPTKNTGEIQALAFEAKKRGALALVVADEGLEKANSGPVTFFENSKNVEIAALPVVVITRESQLEVLNQMKKTPQVSLFVKTEFPAVTTEKEMNQSLYLKLGAHDATVLLSATAENCQGTASLLGILNGIKKSGLSVKSTYFVFTTNKEVFEKNSPEISEKIVMQWSADNLENTGIKDFLSRWVKVDQGTETVVSLSDLYNRASKIFAQLKGLVDGDDLKRLNANMKRLRNAEKAIKLQALYPPKQSQELGHLASEVKTLRQIYSLVQRGSWRQAQKECLQLDGFQWADKVSLETFMDFRKPLPHQVDPRVWVMVSRGKQNYEPLMKLLQAEIDKTETLLSESFLKYEKAIGVFSQFDSIPSDGERNPTATP